MDDTEVLKLLEKNQDQRGITYWQKQVSHNGNLRSFGIGLTRLRKLAKQLGRDRALAMKLWASNVYEAKVLGLLIDDPKQMTRQQAEDQVSQTDVAMLWHVFSSCDATLAKTPFAFDLARQWTESGDSIRRRCGYGLLYELSKRKRVPGMDEAFLLNQIRHIEATIDEQDNAVRVAMATALIGIGKRTSELHKAAMRAAEAIGPVDVNADYDSRCEPIDVAKHLSSKHVKKKLQIDGQGN